MKLITCSCSWCDHLRSLSLGGVGGWVGKCLALLSPWKQHIWSVGCARRPLKGCSLDGIWNERWGEGSASWFFSLRVQTAPVWAPRTLPLWKQSMQKLPHVDIVVFCFSLLPLFIWQWRWVLIGAAPWDERVKTWLINSEIYCSVSPAKWKGFSVSNEENPPNKRFTCSFFCRVSSTLLANFNITPVSASYSTAFIWQLRFFVTLQIKSFAHEAWKCRRRA